MPPFGLSNEEFDELNKLIMKTYAPTFIRVKKEIEEMPSEFVKREMEEHLLKTISIAPLATINMIGEFLVHDEKIRPQINGFIASTAKKIWEKGTYKECTDKESKIEMDDIKRLFEERFVLTINDFDKYDIYYSIASYVKDGVPEEISIDMAIQDFITHIRTIDADDDLYEFFKDLIYSDKMNFHTQMYWTNPEHSYGLLLRPRIQYLIDKHKKEVREQVKEALKSY